jgi:hypothetical protein
MPGNGLLSQVVVLLQKRCHGLTEFQDPQIVGTRVPLSSRTQMATGKQT